MRERNSLLQITLVLGCFFILFLFFIFPLGKLVAVPFFTYENTSELFQKIFDNPSNWKSVKNTAFFASAVTLICALIGLPLAWLISRTRIAGASFLKTLVSLPYAIPPFIGAIAWIYLANPSNGLINQLFGESFLNIYSMTGLIFVESCFLYTFVFLNLTASLDQMDPSLEEAARTSGASPLQIFFKITLPLVRPALINSCLLVFLAACASFGVPALIGGPGRIRVLTTEIYQLQKMATTTGLQMSILLSSLLLLFSIAVIMISRALSSRAKTSLVTGKSSRTSLIDLGSFQWPALVFIWLLIWVVLVLPFLGIFLSATSKIQGNVGFEFFTWSHFSRVLFETEELGRAFRNSLILAFSVSMICSVLALVYGYIETQTNSKVKSFLSVFISLPYSAPGTVVALALIISFSQSFFGIPFSIYNTLMMFVMAYTMKFLNFSFKIVGDNFNQIHPHLIEAAQTSGARTFQVIRHIWIPLLRPSLIASFFLVFVPSLTELTMSVFLTGPGLETLGTMIYQLQEYSDNIGGGAAVLSTFVFIFVVLSNWLVKKLSKGKYGL